MSMSEEDFVISACPTCGSRAIRELRGGWKGSYQGRPYAVEGLEYYSCPNCGEKVYLPEAMRRIQEASPAYARTSRRGVREAPKSPSRARD